MSDDFKRPGFTPASLAGADPFAAPTPRATSRPSHAAPPSPGEAAQIPCPCSCGCGNETGKTYANVESFSAARNLRCEPCGRAMHFGPAWTVDEPAATVGAASSDQVVTGKRAGETFVIRQSPTLDPDDEEWDRQIALQLENERRDAARQRWLSGLPERWRLPYDDGEELAPQVEERLQRLQRLRDENPSRPGKPGQAGDHGTSLVCIGPFGSGKTWVAYTYARAAVDRRLLWPQEIRVGTEGEIMEPIALASPWEVADRAADLLKPSLKMLVIDDVGALGTYKNVDNRHATWAKVDNWAYEHKRALVLTTNMSLGLETEKMSDNERHDLLAWWIGPTAYERLRHMVGKEQVFRDENKRAEMTARWEAEYQEMQAATNRD